MSSTASPQATWCLARPTHVRASGPVTRAHLPALVEVLLFALLATLLGPTRARDAIWRATQGLPPFGPDLDPEDADSWPEYADYSHHTGYHADCVSPLLYVIGPGPNRGMRPNSRAMPTPQPRSARAPPRGRAPPFNPPSQEGRERATIIFR